MMGGKKEALLIVPFDYNQVGGMKFPIENYEKALKTCFDLRVVKIGYGYSKNDFIRIENEIKQQNRTDYIVIYGLNQCNNCMYYLQHIFGKLYKNIIRVALLMDCEYLYAGSVFEKTKWICVNIKLKRLFQKWVYKIREEKCLRWYNDVLYVSSVDADFAKRTYENIKAKIHVIENGIDIPTAYERVSRKAFSPFALGYISHMSQSVIDENILPLLHELLPKIWELSSDIKVIIAGKGMEDVLRQMLNKYPEIEYIGQVGDLEEFYNKVDVIISYTKKKNGILNKILEAWAYSKCVIGYDYNFNAFLKAVNGRDYIGKSETEDIAQAVIDAYSGKIDVHEIGDTARELVRKEYNWCIQREKFLSIFGEYDKN